MQTYVSLPRISEERDFIQMSFVGNLTFTNLSYKIFLTLTLFSGNVSLMYTCPYTVKRKQMLLS